MVKLQLSVDGAHLDTSPCAFSIIMLSLMAFMNVENNDKHVTPLLNISFKRNSHDPHLSILIGCLRERPNGHFKWRLQDNVEQHFVLFIS